MNLADILFQLRAERDRLTEAIAALEGGRAQRVPRRKRRRMSAAARKRISDAQKARWAKQKKQAKAA